MNPFEPPQTPPTPQQNRTTSLTIFVFLALLGFIAVALLVFLFIPYVGLHTDVTR